MRPIVSVVLATYNQAPYLREAIESVTGQTFSDWELVIVDNGSNDESHAILREYEGHPKIRLLLHPENGLVTGRLNEAIGHTEGEFISILYGDDFYLPQKLERQLECFAGLGPDVGIVHGPGYRLNQLTGQKWLAEAPEIGDDPLRDLLIHAQGCFINPIAPLFRRTCWERYPFDEELFIEGEAVYLRYALRFGFHRLDVPLVVMRDHESNVGKATRANVERLVVMLEKLAANPEFPKSHLPYLRRFESASLRGLAWEMVRLTSDMQGARSYFRRAVKAHWRQALHPRTIIGMGLTALPGSIRNTLNESADRVLSHPGNVHVLGDEYGMPQSNAVPSAHASRADGDLSNSTRDLRMTIMRRGTPTALRPLTTRMYRVRGLARIADKIRCRFASRDDAYVVRHSNGFQIRCRLSSHIESVIFWRGRYSEDQLLYLDSRLRPEDVFIDVGANIGEHTLFAAGRLSRGMVYSFEPMSVVYDALMANVGLNGFDNIELVRRALGDVPSTRPLYTAGALSSDGTVNGGLGTLAPSSSRSTMIEEVQVSTLDQFVAERGISRVDYIKIDVEGSELSVLRGAEQTIARFHPILIVEVNGETSEAAGYTAATLLEWVAARGYRIEQFVRGGSTRVVNSAGELTSADVICFPTAPRAQ